MTTLPPPEPGTAPRHARRGSTGTSDVLAEGHMTIVGILPNASNLTLLVQLTHAQTQVHAVYKPRAGETSLWDFPPGTLCQREVASYEVSELLGWALVPPTLLRDGPEGVGSVQLFVRHDPTEHYFTLLDEQHLHARLLRMAAFDVVINNADRKASHVLRDGDGRILGCDHGLTFHVHPKLRTVIWEFAGGRLPGEWCADLERLAELVGTGAPARARLCELLAEREVDQLAERARRLASAGALPRHPGTPRAYPWPPL